METLGSVRGLGLLGYASDLQIAGTPESGAAGEANKERRWGELHSKKPKP